MKTKSPLKSAPLRVPGQSLDEQIQELMDDKVAPLLYAAGTFVVVAMAEWVRYFSKQPPQPWLHTVIAVIAISFVGWKLRGARTRLRQLKQGLDGERVVGQMLERTRTLGFKVFHDVPTGDANIDHVLIGPRGVYTIETKTISKPSRGACNVRVMADGIRMNDQMLDRNPLIQAKAQAAWLRGYFGEASFKTAVRSVVLFPGWFVEPHDRAAAGAWVLEPKALESFLAQERESLTPEQADAMALALAAHIRAMAKV